MLGIPFQPRTDFIVTVWRQLRVQCKLQTKRGNLIRNFINSKKKGDFWHFTIHIISVRMFVDTRVCNFSGPPILIICYTLVQFFFSSSKRSNEWRNEMNSIETRTLWINCRNVIQNDLESCSFAKNAIELRLFQLCLWNGWNFKRRGRLSFRCLRL